MHERAMKAEKIIHRTREAFDSAGKDSVVDIGDFEVDILMVLLGKHANKDATIETVAADFAAVTFGSSSAAVASSSAAPHASQY